jgi:hypothetical protein
MDVAKGVLPNLRQQILVLSEAARAVSRYDAASELPLPYQIVYVLSRYLLFKTLTK